MPAGRLAALRVAGFFIDWLSGAPVADTQSGFRVYPASLLAAVRPRRGGFVLETEMLLRAADRGVSVREVPITPIHFEDRRSRFRPARDGLAVGTYLAGRIVGRWAREALAGAAWVVGIFSAARLRARHREMYQFAAPHRSNPPGWALAVGAFVTDRALRTVERGLGSDHARGLRLAAVATAATPLLLVLALGRSALAALGIDWLGPVVRNLYPQEAMAATLEAPARRAAGAARPADYDVLVVGGGPGGSSAATFLSRGGLRVALAEREAFPRFHVGESLLPANMPVLERLGVLDAVKARGFLVKYGAYFHDQDMDRRLPVLLPRGQAVALLHLRGPAGRVRQDPARSRGPAAERDAAAARHRRAGGLRRRRRDRHRRRGRGLAGDPRALPGRRERARRVSRDPARPPPSHRGARQGRAVRPLPGRQALAGKEAGNIRIFSFEPGWFWYIPFHNGTSSVGCVLHARTVRGREGNLEQLYESLITRCRGLVDALDGARASPRCTARPTSPTRPSPPSATASCAWATRSRSWTRSSRRASTSPPSPPSSPRPRSSRRSGRTASRRVASAAIRRRSGAGMQPFQRFIRNFYDPSFTEVFLKPREFAGMVDGVTGVLAGGAFLRMSLRMRLSLEVFFTVVRINRWVRRRRGLATESRFKW